MLGRVVILQIIILFGILLDSCISVNSKDSSSNSYKTGNLFSTRRSVKHVKVEDINIIPRLLVTQTEKDIENIDLLQKYVTKNKTINKLDVYKNQIDEDLPSDNNLKSVISKYGNPTSVKPELKIKFVENGQKKFVKYQGVKNINDYVTDAKKSVKQNNDSIVNFIVTKKPQTSSSNHEIDSVEHLGEQRGFPVETHTVLTEDGFELTVHRIPHGRQGASGRGPVLLHHGLLACSAVWLLRDAHQDLAYLLADAGYDVWITNSRGNTYSRHHLSLSPNDPRFWKFSFHEMGYYDLAAVVDYILNVTGNQSLFFVGHSMGTTVSYVLCSMRPEYNKKFKLIVSLAPVAFLRPRGLLLRAAALTNQAAAYLRDAMVSQGVLEVLPHSLGVTRIGRALCGDRSLTQPLCLTAMFIIAGVDYKQFNASILPRILGYFPAGTSIFSIAHFYQLVNSGEFRQYDYGEQENLIRYNQKKPPSYDLKKITAPISLHYGENDVLTRPEDVEELAQKLPNMVGLFRVPYDMYNHLDFLWANQARQLLYEPIISLMDKYR